MFEWYKLFTGFADILLKTAETNIHFYCLWIGPTLLLSFMILTLLSFW